MPVTKELKRKPAESWLVSCIAGHSLYNDERSFDLLWLIDGSTSLMSSRWAEIYAKMKSQH